MNVFYSKEQEEALVVANTPLVISIAFTFKPIPPNDYDDLISVGMIGLLKAIRAFNPGRGYKFSTLASLIIKREIIRELERVNYKHKLVSSEQLSLDIEDKVIGNLADYLPEDLTEQDKNILYLRFYLNSTFEEIGKKLGYTRQWVNLRIKSILSKIRESNEKTKNLMGK